MINDLPHIPVTFPEKEIFLRLEGNLSKTRLLPEEKSSFLLTAKKAFSLCHPAGRWGILPVNEISETGISLADGSFIPGGDFARRCEKITHLWFGAVTIGNILADRAKKLESVSMQAIYDAVGSETADAAMESLVILAKSALLHRNLVPDPRRWSPGYGDMSLETQKFFFSALKLAELDMVLSDNFYMTPEKSVTAFAGVRNFQE
ncbi:MAG: hypothetical protein IJW33_05380 [Lentisphaeria bacterium]|nr:hypothetical protein [Lentisphaeria bacterium]